MRSLVAALLAFSLLVSPVQAAPTVHTITGDPGGEILGFIAKYVQWRDNGDSVRIEGECNSACTLVLGIVPTTRICATRNAEFGFHSAMAIYTDGSTEYSPDGTQLLWLFYQGRVQRVLNKYGWPGPSNHPDIITIEALEFVRPCKWEDYHGKGLDG